VAVKPTPASVLPVAVRAVIAWIPGPVRPCPDGVAAFQSLPLGDVHTTTSCWPWTRPYTPVAVKPRPVAARAVTVAWPSGAGSANCDQVAPPSDEAAANGTCRPVVVSAVPAATTVRPLSATCWSTALA
jgi:hypothetical protein